VPNLPERTSFQQFRFGCQQIFYVRDIAEREHEISISINGLVRVCDCPRTSVQSASAHGSEPTGARGNRPALDGDREEQILDWIQHKAEQGTSVGKTEIKDYRTTQLKIPMTCGWVISFVGHHSGQIFKTKGTPQEQQRLPVPRMFLERTVQDLEEHISGWMAELVFNLDEADISDWEDRKVKTVIVPARMLGQTQDQDISRTVQHIGCSETIYPNEVLLLEENPN
jgi:hypothetical protein